MSSSTEKHSSIYYSDNLDLEYKVIKDFVGGNFTYIDLQDGRLMLLNEEGIYKYELNKEASKIFEFNIYGNVVVIGIKHD